MKNLKISKFKVALLSSNFCTIGLRELFLNSEYNLCSFETSGKLIIAKQDFSVIIYEIGEESLNHVNVVKDLKLAYPSTQVIVINKKDNLLLEAEFIHAGAFWYFSLPLTKDEFQTIISKAIIFFELLNENEELKNAIKKDDSKIPFFMSSNMEKLIKKIDTTANLDIGILLEGESGTGKTMLAEYIHNKSLRSNKPFISISCAALPKDLLEAELFGYEKGAFTGAITKYIGSFEQADGGTLFLDEIGELPLDLQAKLLTILQDFKVKRLGSTKVNKINIRVIAATNRSLKEMCKNGEFREDLYYRLCIVNFTVPPLRDRIDDVEGLAIRILDQISKERSINKISLKKESLVIIKNYKWPGNIRELNNVLQRASIFCKNSLITPEDLNLDFETKIIESNNKLPDLSGFSIKEIESKVIIDTLSKFNGNKKVAAQNLGISLKSLYNKLEQIIPN